ncbi:vWA domain-containing protein [Breznakiella homolactica]|uniref:VWA domain-containing protein n=1 Tax=Breznakiella homolactica TaxID=2798577 RepID=A0A7T8B9U2_9SPIR|nr:vWA domain-containing protein [Breznakiella homolactica]QQO07548.1 VWA domain-containing protein [Breznakiella homolactica]
MYTQSAYSADNRTESVDVYLIFDSSAAINNSKDAAINWAATVIIGDLLQNGDNLNIWTVSERPELIFSGTIRGDDEKAGARDALRAIKPAGGTANYAAALREADRRREQTSQGRMVYTLLISGGGVIAASPAQEQDLSGLLRYAKIDDFPGWKAMVIGLGLDAQVRNAAVAYMNAVK